VRNPRCYDRLAAEIRVTFSSSAEICGGPKLSGCQYLRACIDECLRISPPIPGTLWRERADNDPLPICVDGHEIPEGTQIGVNIYAIHHNEDYFPEPFSFKPERWLPSKEISEEQWRLMNAAFSPFSIGERVCAGKSMAYLESSLIIAKTLWYFDFQAAPGQLGEVGGGTPGNPDNRDRPNEYQLYDTFNGAHNGPYLVFRVKGDYAKELHTKAPAL
jgi:cytochrome P450